MENAPSKFDLIDDKSDELQEIIGKKPRWVVQWGSSLVFVFLGLLLVLSYVVRYPDIITAEVMVTKSQPPVRLFAKQSGNIRFVASDRQSVKETEVLAILQSPGESKDLLHLVDLVDTLTAQHMLGESKIPFPASLVLGEYQSYYSRFLKDYQQHQLLISLEPNKNDVLNILDRKQASERVIEELNSRIRIAENKLALLEKDFARNEMLLNQNAIAPKDLEDKKALVIDQKDFIQSLVLDRARENKFLTDLKRELTQAEYTEVDALAQAKRNLNNSFAELKSAVRNWQYDFTISSPLDGKVSLNTALLSNQFVNEGDEVLAVIQEDTTERFFGILSMPIANSGKVQVGQRVNVSLTSFPDHQYGMLVGEVYQISALANDGNIKVVVELPLQLETNYGMELPAQVEFVGSAEIITEDLRLIERLLNQLRRNLSNQ